MFNIEYVTSVPYSAKKMFYLINDINSYSKFVPGCNESKILEYRNNELIAELNVVINGIIKSLITHNIFIENRNIGIFLLKGPFKSFYGYWEFVSITSSLSRIKYFSCYEFSSTLSGMIFNYAFQKIYKRVIQSFFYRAYKIYGVPNSIY